MRLELICFLFCAFFLKNYSATRLGALVRGPTWDPTIKAVEGSSTTLPTTVAGIKNNTLIYMTLQQNITILISFVLNLSSQIPIFNSFLPKTGDKEENNLRCYEGMDWRIVTCDHGVCVKISTLSFGIIPIIAGRTCIPRKAWEEREVHSLTLINF